MRNASPSNPSNASPTETAGAAASKKEDKRFRTVIEVLVGIGAVSQVVAAIYIGLTFREYKKITDLTRESVKAAEAGITLSGSSLAVANAGYELSREGLKTEQTAAKASQDNVIQNAQLADSNNQARITVEDIQLNLKEGTVISGTVTLLNTSNNYAKDVRISIYCEPSRSDGDMTHEQIPFPSDPLRSVIKPNEEAIATVFTPPGNLDTPYAIPFTSDLEDKLVRKTDALYIHGIISFTDNSSVHNRGTIFRWIWNSETKKCEQSGTHNGEY